MCTETDPRDTPLNNPLAELVQVVGSDFAMASDHPYTCRCGACLNWWATVGPEEGLDGELHYGPFSAEEVQAATEILKKSQQEEGPTFLTSFSPWPRLGSDDVRK